VTITSNTAAPPPAPVLLSGEGVHVILETLPLNVDFGAIDVNASASATLQVANVSNGTATGFPLEVWGLTPALPPEFGVGPGSCGPFPFTLAYLDSCELEFSFTPGGTTGNFIFTTGLANDASVRPGPFDLTGTALLIEIFRDRFENRP